MMGRAFRGAAAALAIAVMLPAAACSARQDSVASSTTAASTVAVTIASAGGVRHAFRVETARNAAEQEHGLMFRTDLTDDGGMLFYPYPPDSGAPRVASFWMKNTPSPLDIIYIRADGTIAKIANAVPFDETPISSDEPVGAVLELKGGRTAALGIAEGDKVTWPR